METTAVKPLIRRLIPWLLVLIAVLAAILFTLPRQMSEQERSLRGSVVTAAQQYLGCNEADGSHEAIIDAYNTQEVLPRGYAVTYTDSWCATFVSAVAMESPMADWIPRECSCQQMIELFDIRGEWEESDWHIPQTGDIIFYAWGELPIGECTGWADHVGIVVGVYGPVIKVIEGNKDDAVAYRYIWIGHPEIRGYGLPDYRKAAACS